MNFRYYVLKKYNGVFIKKHSGNIHIIYAPINSNESMYLVIVGKLLKDSNSYVCQLILRESPENVNKVIELEKEKFKNNYILIEELSCKVNDLDQGKYEYLFSNKGKYIKSDLSLIFEPEYSDEKNKIFVLKGNIELETEDVKPNLIKMISRKKMAMLGHSK